MKKLLVVTDAWEPQTNGVVTTLKNVIEYLPEFGYGSQVIHPGSFKTWPLPSYPEIRIARDPWRLKAMILETRPDTVHIATEGPLGLAARRVLCRLRVPFTTSLHTKFPEYVDERIRLPLRLGYNYLRWFHRPAPITLVTTESHREELANRGLRDLVVWGCGVDTCAFHPVPHTPRMADHLNTIRWVAGRKLPSPQARHTMAVYESQIPESQIPESQIPESQIQPGGV